jgi:hypothetical protein
LKLGLGRFFRGACNWIWNVLLQKDIQVWANKVLILHRLQGRLGISLEKMKMFGRRERNPTGSRIDQQVRESQP